MKRQKASKSIEQFDVSAAPKPNDWRYFIKASDDQREKLWGYHARRGLGLKDWAWGWRLGWVRVCERSASKICGLILKEALSDKALVVRAEAATRIGRRFEGKKDEGAASALAGAYDNPRNYRGGKPLFVQNRILFALKSVGGDVASELGEKLSARHPEMSRYWKALARAEN